MAKARLERWLGRCDRNGPACLGQALEPPQAGSKYKSHFAKKALPHNFGKAVQPGLVLPAAQTSERASLGLVCLQSCELCRGIHPSMPSSQAKTLHSIASLACNSPSTCSSSEEPAARVRMHGITHSLASCIGYVSLYWPVCLMPATTCQKASSCAFFLQSRLPSSAAPPKRRQKRRPVAAMSPFARRWLL